MIEHSELSLQNSAFLPLAGITELLGLEWSGPDWTYPTGPQAVAWFVAFNVVSIALSIVAAWLVLREMPVDYFRQETDAKRPLPARIGRNVLGVVVLLVGVVFLLSPGQGMVLILIGLMLTDLPGRRRFERAIARREPVLRLLNWARRKLGRDPLLPPDPAS